MDKICDRLKMLRDEFRKTQKEVADYLQITQQVYSKYENGKVDLPIRLLQKLVDYYSVSADYILGNTYYPDWEFKYLSEERQKDLICYLDFLFYMEEKERHR